MKSIQVWASNAKQILSEKLMYNLLRYVFLYHIIKLRLKSSYRGANFVVTGSTAGYRHDKYFHWFLLLRQLG